MKLPTHSATSVLKLPDVEYKPLKAKIVDTLRAGQTLGTYMALNRTDEDQRYLSTKVQVGHQSRQRGNGQGKLLTFTFV